MNEKVFMDQYQKNFLNEEEFIVFLQEREENSAWQREKSSEIRFLAADDQKVTMFMENEENHEMQPIMEDTLEHTRLVLKVQDSFYPVCSCAVKTILDRARVSGNALNMTNGRAILYQKKSLLCSDSQILKPRYLVSLLSQSRQI